MSAKYMARHSKTHLASKTRPETTVAKLRKLLKMPVVANIRSMPVEPLADGTIIGRSTHARAECCEYALVATSLHFNRFRRAIEVGGQSNR